MRLNKRVAAGMLAVGLVFTGMQRAGAGTITVSDLYGTWTGTYTPQQNPTPLLITPSGTSDFSTPAGFYDPQPESFDFTTSSQFAFSLSINGDQEPGTVAGGTHTQTGASFSNNTFTVDREAFVPLSNGETSEYATTVITGTIQVDPQDAQDLLMTGTIVPTPTVSSLPSNRSDNVVVSDSDFSLTMAMPSGSSGSGSGGSGSGSSGGSSPVGSAVPLPPAAGSSLAMLGGLGVLWAVRSRRSLALNV